MKFQQLNLPIKFKSLFANCPLYSAPDRNTQIGSYLRSSGNALIVADYAEIPAGQKHFFQPDTNFIKVVVPSLQSTPIGWVNSFFFEIDEPMLQIMTSGNPVTGGGGTQVQGQGGYQGSGTKTPGGLEIQSDNQLEVVQTETGTGTGTGTGNPKKTELTKYALIGGAALAAYFLFIKK